MARAGVTREGVTYAVVTALVVRLGAWRAGLVALEVTFPGEGTPGILALAGALAREGAGAGAAGAGAGVVSYW